MRSKTLPLGSLVSDVGGHAQTLTACLAILDTLSPALAGRYRARPIVSRATEPEPLSVRETIRLIETVKSILRDLNRWAPPFAYVGHHPTDQAHLGVWIDLGALHRAEEAGQLVQAPILTRGLCAPFVLDMSGAGLTLYRRRGKVKVWQLD